MALTKVSGPLLNSGNHNLGNYVINNITGAAATFSSLDVSGGIVVDTVSDLTVVGILTNNTLTPGTVAWVGTGQSITESDNLTWDNTNVRLKNLGITSTKDLNVTGISTLTGKVLLGNRLGIGSDSPTSPLNVAAETSTGACVRLIQDATNKKAFLYFQDWASGGNDSWIQNENSDLTVYAGYGGKLNLGAYNKTGITVLTSGNIGIGSTTPADLVTIGAGGTTLTIEARGRIGIGTDTVPRDMVHIHNPTANASSYIQFTNANTAGTGINDGTLIGISQNNSNTDGTGSGFTILQKENAEITLGTQNLERFRITGDGITQFNTTSVAGIGTTCRVQIDSSVKEDGILFGNTYTYGIIARGASNGALVYTGNAGPANLGGGNKVTHEWWSGSAGGGGPNQLMSLTTGGELLLGHTSVIEPDGYESSLQVTGTNTAAGISILRYGADSGGPTLLFGKSRGATIGTASTVAENDSLGKIEFYGTDNNWESSASVRACADGEWYSGSAGSEDNTDCPGRLEFHTTPNGSDNLKERLRITAAGRILIGTGAVSATSNPVAQGGLQVSTNGASGAPTLMLGADNSAANTQSITDNTGKDCRIGFPNYDIQEEPLALLNAFVGNGDDVNSTGARICYGGGSSWLNSVNNHIFYTHATAQNGTTGTERLRILADGSILHKRSTNDQRYDLEFRQTGGIGDGNYSGVKWTQSSDGGTFLGSICMSYSDTGRPDMIFYQRDRGGSTGSDEGFRLTRDGNLTTCETHTFSRANAGFTARKGDSVSITRDTGTPIEVNRLGNDGYIMLVYQAGSNEGGIHVSGSSVTLVGGSLSRWSQLVGISTNNKADRPSIYSGTIMSNLDEMCEWPGEENMQLNKTQVSTVSGDKNVAGVFRGWDDDDDTYTNDFFIAQTGDYIIRVGAATTVTRGDLLESAGDGTAKPQSDDIVRSKTIAKVTSGIAHTTYPDGSKTYPCVLMTS